MKIGLPEGVAEGPVWHVPYVSDNKANKTNPFRVKIRPLTHKEVGGLAGISRIQELEGNIETIQEVFVDLIKRCVIAVENLEVYDHTESKWITPINGEELIDALEKSMPIVSSNVITEVGSTCMRMTFLTEEAIENLEFPQPSPQVSGKQETRGPARAAKKKTTQRSMSGATDSGRSEAATNRSPKTVAQ